MINLKNFRATNCGQNSRSLCEIREASTSESLLSIDMFVKISDTCEMGEMSDVADIEHANFIINN